MRTKVIGLTGQTGAGKSTAAHAARQAGCRVLDADKIAREALTAGSDCLKRLAELFGYDIIDEKGECRRGLLAQRAFASKENTELLNSTTHPWIIRRAAEYIEAYKAESDCPILFDAPQLFESGGDALCDYVIAVTAPAQIRLERIMARDGISREEALLRINAQHPSDYYTRRADAVIDGSLPPETVAQRLQMLIDKMLRKEV